MHVRTRLNAWWAAIKLARVRRPPACMCALGPPCQPPDPSTERACWNRSGKRPRARGRAAPARPTGRAAPWAAVRHGGRGARCGAARGALQLQHGPRISRRGEAPAIAVHARCFGSAPRKSRAAAAGGAGDRPFLGSCAGGAGTRHPTPGGNGGCRALSLPCPMAADTSSRVILMFL